MATSTRLLKECVHLLNCGFVCHWVLRTLIFSTFFMTYDKIKLLFHLMLGNILATAHRLLQISQVFKVMIAIAIQVFQQTVVVSDAWLTYIKWCTYVLCAAKHFEQI